METSKVPWIITRWSNDLSKLTQISVIKRQLNHWNWQKIKYKKQNVDDDAPHIVSKHKAFILQISENTDFNVELPPYMVSRAWIISAFKSSKSSTPKLNRTKLSLIPYFSLSDWVRSLYQQDNSINKSYKRKIVASLLHAISGTNT